MVTAGYMAETLFDPLFDHLLSQKQPVSTPFGPHFGPLLACLAPKWSFLTPYVKGTFESTPGLTHVFDKRSQKGGPKVGHLAVCDVF